MSQAFINFARAHGLEIDPGKIYARDRIVRCGTTAKPRSTNGAYHWDGSRGWVFAWDGEGRVNWFDDPNAKPWTAAEKAAWKARRAAASASQEVSHQRAAARAAELLRITVPGPHDYLIRKGLPDVFGLVLPDGALMVPMRALGGELVGAQVVRWMPDALRWDKRMLPGMKAKGAVLRIGPARAAEVVLCEGYATGLSIAAALRQLRLPAAVLVCFSDHGLAHVAGQVAGRRYVFADHDASGAGQRAAEATGLPWTMSPVEGEDANDMHKRAGLMSLASTLMRLRAKSKGCNP